MVIPIPDEVREGMSHVLTSAGIERWWVTEIPALDGLTPAYAWECWCQDDVRKLIKDYRDGSFT